MAPLYYIVPVLVEQPTWGGEYIVQFKGLTSSDLGSKKIGQSFELAKDSVVIPKLGQQPAYGFATASDIAHPEWCNISSTSQSLQSVIDTDPAGVLGTRALAQLGPTMNILIKFTQAKNNSYQVHVKPGAEFGQWLAKPESWYYFEPGRATLGLAPGVDVEAYRRRCQKIDAFAQVISAKITAGTLSLTEGKTQLAEFIDRDHPRRFVNVVDINAGQIIDLSSGGIHHSWEYGQDLPEGNRVYEVQVDVRDEYCTLRSFDQGSIKDDGRVRPLTIDDYFKALDSSPENNVPDRYMSTTDQGTTELSLFNNPHYRL